MKKGIIVIVVIVVLVLLYGFTTYNNLVTSSVAADTQWKQVEVDYQRRFDLIPNLVASVNKVITQEKEVFSAIADARSRYSGAATPAARAAAANEVEGALSRLLVIMEQYPQLKSSEVIQTLMSQLEGTENRISVERSRYNKAVETYNLKVMRIPSSIVAAITGFDTREYFNAQAGAEIAPKVE